MLEKELSYRLFSIGIKVKEARITHLKLPPEIAAAMYRRQRIVNGAVNMIECAIFKLEKKGTIKLDDQAKANLACNMLFGICSDKYNAESSEKKGGKYA